MKNTELISYLEAVVNSLKQGKIVIEQGTQFVSLTPAEVIRVEMETKQKKDKEKLSLEFSWKVGLVVEPDEEGVKISSEAPPPSSSKAEAEMPASAVSSEKPIMQSYYTEETNF